MADGATVPVGTAEVSVKVDLGPLERGFSQAQQATQRFEQQASRTSNVVEGRFARAISSSSTAAYRFNDSIGRVSAGIGLIPGPAGAAAARVAALSTSIAAFNPGVVALSLAVGALVSGFVKASAEAEKFERQMFRTEALLRATGNTAGLTAEQIFELSESIESATLASGEDVQRAAQRLIQFGETAGEEFERTLRLAQDLSASGFGNIVTSVEAIGLAFERPEQAIRRFRGVISEATLLEAQLLLEAGEEAEAHDLVLQALADTVGGLGEAEAGGLTGAYHRLGDAVDDAFRDFGRNTGIVDAQKFAIDRLTESIRALDNVLQGRRAFEGIELPEFLGGAGPPVPEAVEVTPRRRTQEEIRHDREAERQLALDRRAELAENRRLREEAVRLARERKELIESSNLEIIVTEELTSKLLASGQANEEVTRQLQLEKQIRETLLHLKTSEAEAEGAAIAENMRLRAEQDRQLATSLQTREARAGIEDAIAALDEEAEAFDMTARAAAEAGQRIVLIQKLERGEIKLTAEEIDDAVRRFGDAFTNLELKSQFATIRDITNATADFGRELMVIGLPEAGQMAFNFSEQLRKTIRSMDEAGKDTRLLKQAFAELVETFEQTAEIDLSARHLDDLKNNIEALNLELDIQARTFGMTEVAAAAYRFEQQALARQIELTGIVGEKQRADIAGQAEEYKRLTQALMDLDAQRRASDFLSGELNTALEDIIFNAKSLTDAFNDLAQAIAKAVLQALLFGQGPLAGLGGGAGGGGLLGDLIKMGVGALGRGTELPIPESVEVTPPVGLAGVDDAANAAALSASATALSASATGLTGSSTALTGSATGLTGAATGLTGAVTGLTGVATAFTGVTTALSTAAAGLSGAAGALSAAAAAIAASGTASTATDALSTAATAAAVFHKGGVVGRSGGAIRFASPAIFANAPRLHDGLRFDEFPAILQRGEEVIPRDDARRVARTVINAPINIMMPPGSERREFRPNVGKLGQQLVRYLSEAEQRH